MVNKRVQNAVLGCNLKNDRMISVGLQGKSFHITVIQAYAPTSDLHQYFSNVNANEFLRHLTKLPDILHFYF